MVHAHTQTQTHTHTYLKTADGNKDQTVYMLSWSYRALFISRFLLISIFFTMAYKIDLLIATLCIRKVTQIFDEWAEVSRLLPLGVKQNAKHRRQAGTQSVRKACFASVQEYAA